MIKKFFLLLISIIIPVLVIISNQSPLKAAPGDWTLVWSDEFNAPDGSAIDSNKWGFRIDNGWSDGQYAAYTNRIQNCYIQNNMCVIKAMKEAYLGFSFTSARINTFGKFDFTYGKIEMSAKLPYGQGMWPSFWLLGSNISSAPWPNCGEIDVMNNIGREPGIIHSSVFGPGYPSGYGAAYTLPGGAQFKDGFHTFTVEWEPNVIRWYCDGNLYDTRTPADVSPNSWPFDKSFNLYVNLDIGGNWPGYPDNTTIFPQYFTIDYIRVYQREGGVYPTPTPIKIEAESYAAMSGIQTQSCSEGTLNVGWIDTGDWMDYKTTIPANGSYRVDYRIASPNSTGKVDFQVGGTTLASTTIPNTGGWQAWKTISTNVKLQSGAQTIRLLACGSSWNLNWFSLNQVLPTPTPSPKPTPTPIPMLNYVGSKTQVEAESYCAMSGVQTENCSEGGKNVGWIDTGDWMDYYLDAQYNGVNAIISVDFRVSSPNTTGRIDLKNGATILGTIAVPKTGGWQAWTTVSILGARINPGIQTLRVTASGGGWNINWLAFTLEHLDPPPISPGTNIALNQPVSASSTETGFSPSAVVDGNESTRWSSVAAAPQWIEVTLNSGFYYTIERVKLNWDAAYAKSYQIQLIGTGPATPYLTIAGDGGIDDIVLNSTSWTRSVRIYCTESATGAGFSLREIEVYGQIIPTP